MADDAAAGVVVARDDNQFKDRGPVGSAVTHDADRFRLLFSNGRPAIPEDYCEPVQITTIRQMIGTRLRTANTSPAESESPLKPVETQHAAS